MNKKSHLTIVSYLLITFLFIMMGIFLITRKDSRYQDVVIAYNESENPIDYRVYLKKNNFFEKEYLEEGVTYISSLINYIDLDFNYGINYNYRLKGNYKYNIKATILANKMNDQGNYWSKEYQLASRGDSFNNSGVNIHQNLKINYQEYNDLLTSFKKEYGLAIDGILRVEMFINTDGYIDDGSVVACDKECNHLKKDAVLKVDIPLTQNSVDIAIDTNEKSTSNGTITYKKKVSESSGFLIIRLVGVVVLLLALIPIISMINYIIKKNKMISNYHKEIKRILSTYDGIIVNTETINDLSSYNVIKVNSFEELLDAHSEVRMPINYVELRKNYSIFVLINNDIAWVYRVVGDEYE